MSTTLSKTGHWRASDRAESWIVWPGFTGPGGLAETNFASSHSPNRSGVVRTSQTRPGEADVTAAGQTLTITPLTLIEVRPQW